MSHEKNDVSSCCSDFLDGRGSSTPSPSHGDSKDFGGKVSPSACATAVTRSPDDIPMMSYEDVDHEAVTALSDAIAHSDHVVQGPVFRARKHIVWSKEVWQVQVKIGWAKRVLARNMEGYAGSLTEPFQNCDYTWTWVVEEARVSIFWLLFLCMPANRNTVTEYETGKHDD